VAHRKTLVNKINERKLLLTAGKEGENMTLSYIVICPNKNT